MTYQQDLQVILNKYPEIKRIRVEMEDVIERDKNYVPLTYAGQIIPLSPGKVKTPKPRTDLFELEPAPTDYPEKKSLDPAMESALAATLAALNNPPNL